MIPECDAEPAEAEHYEKQRDLEPVEAEMPDVGGDGGEAEEERSHEETAGDPVDAIKGYSEIHWIGGQAI
jgi:hypothetical protein